MDRGLIEQYLSLTGHLEQPIREIVPALWDLSFVVDTGQTCFGHILSAPGYGQHKFNGGPYFWYPHRATLNVAYSTDPGLIDERDHFRDELRAVFAECGGVRICFDQVCSCVSGPDRAKWQTSGLWDEYSATAMEGLPESEVTVRLVETLLVDFWEKVADVVRRYNPQAKIGPVGGKNFRKVINWADWRSVFLGNPG